MNSPSIFFLSGLLFLVDVVTLRENGSCWQVVRVLLVAIATRQEYGNNLGEAEEEADSAGQTERVIDGALQLGHARQTGAVFRESLRAADGIDSIAGRMIVGHGRVESTANKLVLHLLLDVDRRQGPALLGKLTLLALIHCQTGAGNRELNQEQHKQNYHVEEQHHLVMLDSTDETENRDQNENHAASQDATDDG